MPVLDILKDPAFSKKIKLVGGAVRDLVLGSEPKDRDYVIVGASASDVERMMDAGFKQVGADFPVFLHPETGAEYALARIERKIGDGYLGFSVKTEGVTLEEDLSRRDFTMNAMAIGDDGGLIDPYGGQEDLRKGIIRHTSGAFAEDPLRVLRAARFSARYSFKLHESTFDLCREMCSTSQLRHLSNERIWIELEKGLGENPSAFMHALACIGALESHPVLEALFPYQTKPFWDKKAWDIALRKTRHPWRIAIATSAETSNVPGIDNHTKKSIDIAQEFFTFGKRNWTGTKFLKLISLAGGLAPSQIFEDLKDIARVDQARWEVCRPDDQHLITAAAAASTIRADQFQIMPGPELGAAIKHGRIKAIAEALGIPE